MRKIYSVCCSLALVVILPGCPKKKADATPDAAVAAIVDASVATPDAATADTTAVDAAIAALPTAATVATVAAPHGCPAGKGAFIVDGKPACEVECGQTRGKGNECTLPLVCIGRSPLAGAEAGAAPGDYCRTPPSGACPGAGQAQFYAAGGKGVCETLCGKDNDPACVAPATCKNNGQLLAVDGKMGQAHRYCHK